MFGRTLLAASVAAVFTYPLQVFAATDAELEQIHAQIKELKQSYESRIEALEKRLQNTENNQANQSVAKSQASNSAPAPGNTMNPEVSLILSGNAANLSQDPNTYKITGFIPGGDIGPGKRGLRLDESELSISANIDPYFSGALTFSLTPDDKVSVEEAFLKANTLGKGFTGKGGRFLSSIGYLNEQHAHTWDFIDAPLTYQAFLGGQFKQDGLQAKWLAPTDDLFIELGAEAGNGNQFPGTDRNKNGAGASSLFAHLGGDVGASHSWRTGVSYLHFSPKDRQYTNTDLTSTEVTNSFDGKSKVWITDFVWKWAPNGNTTQTNFKIQGEYFRRNENGSLTYDTAAASLGTTSSAYSSAQSGYYLQGIYQFMPRWRVGLRTERLNHGTVDLGINTANLTNPDYNPTKNSVMVDYSPSEFSRFRLQFAKDKSRQDITDNQIFLQYIMSLGAHGPHKF